MGTREGEQTGGRTGPRGQDRERGQREGAATRIAPQCARAGRRAEGQRRQGRDEGVPRRHEGVGVGQKHKGAPQPSEPPAVRGGTGQGGARRRDIQRGPGACVRLANTVASKRKRGHRAGEGGGGKAGEERRRPQGGAERPASHKPRGQGARGRQGGEGKGEVRGREGTAKTRTRRQGHKGLARAERGSDEGDRGKHSVRRA